MIFLPNPLPQNRFENYRNSTTLLYIGNRKSTKGKSFSFSAVIRQTRTVPHHSTGKMCQHVVLCSCSCSKGTSMFGKKWSCLGIFFRTIRNCTTEQSCVSVTSQSQTSEDLKMVSISTVYGILHYSHITCTVYRTALLLQYTLAPMVCWTVDCTVIIKHKCT